MMYVLAAAAIVGFVQEPDPPYREWIERLADDELSARDDAWTRLKAAGRDAWPALEKAADRHPDLETRCRARDLLASSRLRRRLPCRILEENPEAPGTLTGGGTAAKIRLIRTLGRYFEESQELLLDLARDPDAETAVAAAQALYENRNTDWAPRLLELYAREDRPIASRMYELLSSAAARIAPADLQPLAAGASPRALARLMNLAVNAKIAMTVRDDLLRGMLREGDAAARHAALAWMRDRGAPEGRLEIEPLLCDPDPGVVSDALATLRFLRRRPDMERLSSLLAHEESAVREEAVQAVAGFEERALVPALRPLLKDPSTAVRQAALAGLWKLQGAAALDDILGVYLNDAGEQREQASAILQSSRDWTLPRIRAMIADADADRRLRALELMARLEGPSPVLERLRDPDESIRRWVLGRLLTLDSAAHEALEVLAVDGSEAIRFDALRALVRRGRRDHLAELQSFVSGTEYAFRYEAAETILEFGGDRAEALARMLAKDPDPPLRRLALNALSERGDPAFAETAFEALIAPDARLQRAGSQYLARLLSRKRDPDLLARLASALDSSQGERLDLVFHLVTSFGDRSHAPAVRALLRAGRAPNPDRAVRILVEWAGERGLSEVVPLMGRDPALNEVALERARELCRRFPEADRKDLEKALAKMLGHTDRRFRRAAVTAAADLGFEPASLARLIDDPDPSVRHAALTACARLSLDGVENRIEAHLDDEDPDVRLLAVSLMIRLRPDSRPALEKAAEREECAWVRRRMEGLATETSRR